MALCLECKADYLPHITVCPACNRALEPEPPAPPPLSADFVPLMGAGYVEGLAAAASLEAAGLEARLTTVDFNIYIGTPMHVTVYVREKDLDAAHAALKLTPAARVPRCVVCGSAATVHQTERQEGGVGTTDYCIDHASVRVSPGSCASHPKVDEDVIKPVEALNARKGIRTVCSCSGSHAGASDGFISLAPAGADPESERLFDAFVNGLQERLKEPEWAGRVSVEWSAVHGAEITLLDRPRARQTWDAFARLISGLP